MSDDLPLDRSVAPGRLPAFGLSVVSPGYCIACKACHARFRRVGATCASCGADHALVGVTIRPLTTTDRLFDPRSTALDRPGARRLALALSGGARARH
jgi:hypothetical protein